MVVDVGNVVVVVVAAAAGVVDVDVVDVDIGYGVGVVDDALQEEAGCYKYYQQEEQQWSHSDEVRAEREICPD